MSNKLRKLLTFNEDNKDILDLLNNKSNASQYVCEAVRFYEQYRNMAVSMTRIEDKLDLLLSKDKTNSSTNNSVQADETVKTIAATGTLNNKQQVTQVQKIDNELKNLILNEED
ncbi:hypothetical protein [Vallitalea maricola]|uniref:Uncharacterized protein n=1 Tax=Vallitalea maricola TaxID=3074433 RepID=A0ACB5UNC5_9FIRM|nr:hypothetical protein AN2V17_36040 [Vallitalea sp. AN17-2]